MSASTAAAGRVPIGEASYDGLDDEARYSPCSPSPGSECGRDPQAQDVRGLRRELCACRSQPPVTVPA